MFTDDTKLLNNVDTFLTTKFEKTNNIKNSNINGIYKINTKTNLNINNINITHTFTNIIGLADYISGISNSYLTNTELIINDLDISILKDNNTIELLVKIYGILENLSNMNNVEIKITTRDEFTETIIKQKLSKTITIIKN